MQKLLHLAFGLMMVGVLAASTQLMGTQPVTAAALDCTETVNLKVFIYDDGRPNVNGGLLSLGGAYVDFSDNIQTGSFETIRYYDNGSFDDDDRRGVIEERTACSDPDTIGITATIGFRENLDCVTITPERQDVDLYEDVELEYTVDDCVRVDPPTATPVPATSTSTPPAATATVPAALPTVQPPREVKCDDGSVKLVPVNFTGQVCLAVAPVVPTAPAAPVAPQGVSPIKPPNTGSAGLLP
jgi:hypothetical protein